jgi:glycosyltransferase involved in cell wall biosynthesis
MVVRAPTSPRTPAGADTAFRSSGAPLVTIAIPAYNRPALLAEALASVERQTAGVPIEVIVCDDGRLDENRAVVGGFGRADFVYMANERPLGAVGNWNRCIGEARGKFVMVLHEDDALYPWYLETVLPRMHDGVAAVCMRTTRGQVRPAVGRPAAAESAAYPPEYFLKSSMTPFPGVLMRRDLAMRLGGFDEKWGPIADYEFWYRLACAGRIEVVRAVGAFYRVGPGQWTDRVWGRMLRLSHLLRLRIAREQFPGEPRLGRWMARFFTCRNARCYRDRFGPGPAILGRCLAMQRTVIASMPAGWVWQALKFATGIKSRHPGNAHDAGRTPQIQQGCRGPDSITA